MRRKNFSSLKTVHFSVGVLSSIEPWPNVSISRRGRSVKSCELKQFIFVNSLVLSGEEENHKLYFVLIQDYFVSNGEIKTWFIC